TGAIALRAQLQALVQRGKKRPDRSHTTTARVGTPPSRPTSGAAGAAKGARVAYGAGPVGHTWGNREGPGPQGAPGRPQPRGVRAGRRRVRHPVSRRGSRAGRR